MESGAWIWGEDVKRGRLYPLRDCPLDGAAENGFVVGIHPENEAAVHHHAEIVQSPRCVLVIVANVLHLSLAV